MIFERGHFDRTIIQESIISKSFTESRELNAKNFQPTLHDVFLSHKHDDLKDLSGVMGLLEKAGAKVYIDSMDNRMPGQTSGETALRIKEIIKNCNKFILLATDKAIESFWCNWELGIGDTYKYIDHIAILPMKEVGEANSQYKGNEYLQIYPTIDYRDGTTKYRNTGTIITQGYYVCKPLDKDSVRIITPLKDWLKK